MNKRTSGKSRGKSKSKLRVLSPIKTSSKKVVSSKKSLPRKSTINAEGRYRLISEIAYYIAERRGFESGHELEDWLLAEAVIKLKENIK